MENKITMKAYINEIDRNVFAVSHTPPNSIHAYAASVIYDFNQKVEAELLQKVSTGALTRLKHQIESELLRRGTK